MNKQCFTCKQLKSIGCFGIRRGYAKDGHVGNCKECVNSKRKLNHNPGADRESNLLIRYGIDTSEYEQMFVAQSGCCYTCKAPQSRFSRALCVDHSERLGVVRGLLCENCNRALGLVAENIETLTNLIAYIGRDYGGAKIIPMRPSSVNARRRYRKAS